MAVDLLLGLHWRDEGKGKIVDVLTPKYDIIARFQGGPNAGHSLVFGKEKFVLHTIPSGIFRKSVQNIVASGVVVDPISFQQEVLQLQSTGVDVRSQLKLSRRAHLILPTHKLLDAFYEKQKGNQKIYFHGAKAGHKVDALKTSDKVCFTVYGNERIDESESWAPYVQSVVVFGRCRLLEAGLESIERLKEFAMKYYPDETLADEQIARNGRATQMFEITIEHMSGKQVQEK